MKYFMFFILVGLFTISFLLTSCGGGEITMSQTEVPTQPQPEIKGSEPSLLTSESTVTLPMFAKMMNISDFDIPGQFLPTLRKASKEAVYDKTAGISETEIIELKITPATFATMPFTLSDNIIYLETTPVSIPYLWKKWINETYVRVVGSIQFLGEKDQFTAASLSWSNETSYVPLFYILRIKLNNAEFFKIKPTGRYRGSSTIEELESLYRKFFPDFSSSEWMGLAVVYAVFEGEKFISTFILGVAYTGLDSKYPSKYISFAPMLELR